MDAPPKSGRRQRGRFLRTLVWVAAALACLALVVGIVRGFTSPAIPTGDNAMIVVRARDVGGPHSPEMGTWASASTYVGQDINHPSPISFDVLAIPVRAVGSAKGVALAVGLVNLACIVGVIWLARRQCGDLGAIAAATMVALLTWSLGSRVLVDPWPPNWSVLPFLVFLFAAWAVANGDAVALPFMVAGASFCLGNHLSFALLVPVIGLVAVVLFVVWWIAERTNTGARRVRGSPVLWGALALGIGGAAWYQPVMDQLNGTGNLGNILQAAGTRPPAPAGWNSAVQAVTSTAVLPPWFLPPTYGAPSFSPDGSGRGLGLSVAALVVLGVFWVAVAVFAARRRVPEAWTGILIAALGVGIAMYTVARSPHQSGLSPHYVRWLWPLGLFVVYVTGVGAVSAFRRPSATFRVWPTRAAAVACTVVVVIASVGALVPANNSSAWTEWVSDGRDDLTKPVLAALPPAAPVLVDISGGSWFDPVGTVLVDVLTERDTPVYFRDRVSIRQYGADRKWNGKQPMANLVVRYGDDALAGDPGGRRVAFVSGLTRVETKELAQLTEELRQRLRKLGGVPFTTAGRDAAKKAKWPTDDPDWALDTESHPLVGLWGGGYEQILGAKLIAPSALGRERLDRYVELRVKADTETAGVFLFPEPQPRPALYRLDMAQRRSENNR